MKQRCLVCQEGNYPICDRCYNEFKKIGESSKIDFIDELLVLIRYKDIPKKFLSMLKFEGFYSMLDFFYDIILREFNSLDYDGIIFVPDDITRRLRRGFNVSFELAKKMSNDYGIPIYDIIKKPLPTKPSHMMTGFDRARVRHNFVLKEDVRDGRYLIVDDVITTGKTLMDIGKLIKFNNPECHLTALAVLGDRR